MTYVFFDPDFEGPNNLRLSLTFAITLARLRRRGERLAASPARQNAALITPRSLKKSAPMHSSSPRAVESKK